METIALTLPAAALLGLGFGAGPCNITCLPYLGPVLFKQGGGAGTGWRTVLPFSAGRLTGYALLGTVAGLLGAGLETVTDSRLVHWLLGAATVAAGLSLLRRGGQGRTACRSRQPAQAVAIQTPGKRRPPNALPLSLFFMGAGMAFNPCAPLGMILLAAAGTGRAAAGLGLGLAFGLGAVLIPALVFSLAVAHAGQQMREHLGRWGRSADRAAPALLILLGLSTALGWIQP